MGNTSKHLYVVLLAGGSGTRLWPSSTKRHPKQFSKLLGNQTLFQRTIKRIRDFLPLSRVWIITNKDYVGDILEQEPLIDPKNIIVEPEKKNTAMAMGVAAAYIYKQDPESVIINLATDHLVNDDALYQKTLKQAAEFVEEQKCLLSVGIVPTFAHTGLGYIELGELAKEKNNFSIYKVSSFKEKPDQETAEKFFKSGKYLWNACNFIWYTKTFLDEFSKLCPDIYQFVDRIYQSIGTNQEVSIVTDSYHQVRSDAIDYAVAEKTDQMYVIPGNFGWNDVGDWKVVDSLSEKDVNGNHINLVGDNADFSSIDTKNCFILSEDKLVTTIGVENLVIINTSDSILVCSKDETQKVKSLIETLDNNDLKKYL